MLVVNRKVLQVSRCKIPALVCIIIYFTIILYASKNKIPRTEYQCNASLRNWLNEVGDQNFEIFKPYNETIKPLDIDNPEIEINLPFLNRNFGFNLTEVFITTYTRDVLFKGKVTLCKVTKKCMKIKGQALIS